MDAVWLARMHEDKVNDQSRSFKPYSSSTSVSSNPLQFSKPPLSTSLSTPTKTPLPIKCLSPEEMQARRDKGLCFNCDEKFSKFHKCKAKFLILLSMDASEGQEELPGNEAELDPVGLLDTSCTISYHALNGEVVPKTLRFQGYVHNQNLSILVYSGSTHNFI